ncbi:tetratricopeptide repeat protein [Longimicrobium sp.]|jgi:tetratricopeptide (TPR) repeat protein|uniref:tetratricopeptide repeat protein n=1 Tax=Longimicrobium sp. TaxID=2029185 RepID=UPI002F91C38B
MREPEARNDPDFRRLILLVDGRRPDLAEREVRDALREFPDAGALHGLLAIALVKQQRDKEAFHTAREGLRLEPFHPWTNQAWAAVHALLPRYQHRRGSIRAVRDALARSPHEPTMHGYLAVAILTRALSRFRKRRLLHEALDVADAGLALEPGHLDCTLVRAQALSALGRADEAREAALRALQIAPEQSAPHTVLGAVELAARNTDRGEKHLREALRINPNDRHAEEKLGVANQNQRCCVALELQLRAWKWPMRLLRAIGVVGTGVGVATGTDVVLMIYCAVCGPFYLLALHPAVWRRLARPESRALLSAPGALRRADVLTARGVIVVCTALVLFIVALANSN